MMRCILLATALAISPVSGQVGKPTPEQKARVKAVFDAWNERRAQWKSVRYRTSGTETVPAGSIIRAPDSGGPGEAVPPTDVVLPRKDILLLDLVGNRHRLERSGQVYSAAGGQSRASASGHDGKELWQSQPLERATRHMEQHDAIILTGNLREAAFTPPDWPCFLAHGIIPQQAVPIVPGKLAPKRDESEFYFHAMVQHEGRPCVVLRTEPDHFVGTSFDEYWVDSGRGGLVLRHIGYAGGAPAMQFDLRYKDVDGNQLLAGWDLAMLRNGRAWRLFRMQVDTCDLEPAFDSEDFALKVLPGMRIVQLQRGGTEDSPSRAKEVSERTFVADDNGRPVQTGGPPLPDLSLWWYAGGACALLAILIVAWRLRRRKPADA